MKAIALLVAALALTGCLANASPADSEEASDQTPRDATTLQAMELGPYGLRPVEDVTIPMSDGVRLSARLFRPDTSEPVPVIVRHTPYGAIEAAIRAMPEGWIWWDVVFGDALVRHGYAFLEVYTRGTHTSQGCFDWSGPREQADAADMIEWASKAAWSSGSVAMTGLSYDGETAWAGAASGHPALKTIVPMGSLTSFAGAIYRNGTSEDRGTSEHAQMHAIGAWHGTDAANRADCQDLDGAALQPYVALTGDVNDPLVRDYLASRDLHSRIVDNYGGSVFAVHGMQDVNVVPWQLIEITSVLEAKGNDVRRLLGAWGHEIPDLASEDVRPAHFPAMLLVWLDQELKEKGPGLPFQTQVDVLGMGWTDEATWPPAASEQRLRLAGAALAAESGADGRVQLVNPAQAGEVPRDTLGVVALATEHVARTEPLARDTRIAGLPRIHATFVPSTSEGARIYAELAAIAPDGTRTVLADAVMDLRYHAGGTTRHALEPGEPVLALMETTPIDTLVPAGHELELRITPGTTWNRHDPQVGAPNAMYGYMHVDAPAAPVDLVWGGDATTLLLPVVAA